MDDDLDTVIGFLAGYLEACRAAQTGPLELEDLLELLRSLRGPAVH